MLAVGQDQLPQKKIDPKTLPKSDEKGNPIRYANKTGHISEWHSVKPHVPFGASVYGELIEVLSSAGTPSCGA
jgi:hypothetical protein